MPRSATMRRDLMQDTEALNDLQAALAGGGMMGALEYLNARTPHRFTAIFCFDDQVLRNSYMFDRETPRTPVWEAFPISQSFCSRVHETNKPFVVGNSLLDPRVADHPARERIISYCGMPLRDRAGQLIASLCHFDYRPVLFSGLDLPFMQSAARILATVLLNTPVVM